MKMLGLGLRAGAAPALLSQPAKQSLKPVEKKQQNKQKNKLMTLTACQGQLFGKARAVVSARR